MNEVEAVREMLSNSAWNGMADIFVSGLREVNVGVFKWTADNAYKPVIDEFVTFPIFMMMDELLGTCVSR